MALFGDTPEKRGEKIAQLLSHRNYGVDQQMKIIELLYKGAVVPAVYEDRNMLAQAIYHRNTLLVDHFIERKIALNDKGVYGATPLIAALERREGATARRLLAAGANLGVADVYGRTPLMLALRNGDLSLARKLVSKKQSLTAKTGKNYTCVVAALESGNLAVLEFVLAANPPLDTVFDNKPLLFLAIDTDKPEMFDMLVHAGCKLDIYAKGAWGQTLIAYARENAHKEIKTRLVAIDAENKRAKAEAAKSARTGWRLTGAHEVCRIEEPKEIPYKVTEIFNFSSGLYTRINQNLETKAESTAIMNLSDISDSAFVDTAAGQLAALGGTMPEKATGLGGLAQSAGKSIISKPKAASS